MKAEEDRNSGQWVSTSQDFGGQYLCTGAESAAVLETGTTTNLARFRWSEHRNKILVGKGIDRVATYSACAQLKFGDGRLGEVRCAAEIPAGTACCRGTRTACVLEAEILALFRKAELETLWGPVGFHS